MKWLKLLSPLYLLTILALFIYSFTQVDLSLTLSRVSVYQLAEKYLQNIGFFQRPLSTVIYIVILVILTLFYFIFLNQAAKRRISFGSIWKIIVVATVILIFSYNAFSYDLFNYIFDAKIVTHYHLIPYFHSALDFPKDPMLSFMRWTHRTFPYGPSWLVLTVPLSFIGMNYFLPTFFLFKILAGASFLGSCYLIYKISEKIFPENKLLNLAFFAFNPLVIIESLVSAHNDIPMIFFFLLSIYLFLKKKKMLSFISNFFSIGVKFSTGFIFPLFLIIEFMDRKDKKINWELFFVMAFLLSLGTIMLATIRSTFQPWYLLLPLSIASFIPRKYYVFSPSAIGTTFAWLTYIPYFYITDYAKEYPMSVASIDIVGLVAVVLFTGLYYLELKRTAKH
jgi:hypothetical protein